MSRRAGRAGLRASFRSGGLQYGVSLRRRSTLSDRHRASFAFPVIDMRLGQWPAAPRRLVHRESDTDNSHRERPESQPIHGFFRITVCRWCDTLRSQFAPDKRRSSRVFVGAVLRWGGRLSALFLPSRATPGRRMRRPLRYASDTIRG